MPMLDSPVKFHKPGVDLVAVSSQVKNVMGLQGVVKQLDIFLGKVVIQKALQMTHARACVQQSFGWANWQCSILLVLIQQFFNLTVELEKCQDLTVHSNCLVAMVKPQMKHNFVQMVDLCCFAPQFGGPTFPHKHCESVEIVVPVSNAQGLVQGLHFFPNREEVLQR